MTTQLNQARSWALSVALPFWAEAGIDPRTGGFRERMTFAAEPILDAPHRLMVQCRQISVYALARTRGWWNQDDVLGRALDHLVRTYWQADGKPGWIFSVDHRGRPLDRRRDTYAHAFALFGLAWGYRVTGDPQLLALADQTLTFIDIHLSAPDGGGLLDGDVRADRLRRQNPHMHFLEAMIALAQASGQERYLARAGEIFGLFSARFFEPTTGALGEYFDENWQPHGTPDPLCEPGHHFEWVWLLRHYQRLTGRSVDRYAVGLYEHARRHGFDAQGFVIDELSTTGQPTKRSRRSWPHAEAIKAEAVEHEGGRPGCDARAEQLLGIVNTTYLAGPFAGGWVDHVDEAGRPLVDYVPASTLYHLLFAIVEADRVFGTAAEPGSHAP